MKISITQYAKTLFELTSGKSEQEVLEVIKSFANQLKLNGQTKNSGKIIEKFTELYNAANGIIEAEVVTIAEIDPETKSKVEKFVKEKYQAREVIVKNIIDKGIKGGIIVKVGDEVIDASIQMQLKKMKKQLVG